MSAVLISGMALVNEGSHSFTCHPHVCAQMEWAILPLLPSHSCTLAGTHFPVPLWVGGWVGLGVGYILRWYTRPKMVIHPSTIWAWHRVILWICPMLLETATNRTSLMACCYERQYPHWF